MRKIGAFLMAMVLAIPAFAQPVCAATCGGGDAVRTSCCCGPKEAPTDGNPSLQSPPCCPSDSVRADLREIDGAVAAGAGTQLVAGLAQPAAATLLADAGYLPLAPTVDYADTGGSRPAGPPIFIALSTLRR